MFIDRVRITVRGGRGGNGCASHWRRRGKPGPGKPDGGSGGTGGSVYLKVDSSLNTLIDFYYRPEWRATKGSHGSGNRRTGRSGEDLVLAVPPGTVVWDEERGEIVGDLTKEGQTLLAAAGGRGGKGNAILYRLGPARADTAEEGGEGEQKRLVLELKVLADVGLVGFPNAGKSSLLSKISAARPKIDSYPFTTLRPVLGMVEVDGEEAFVVADIPGLIEGASTGAGLGHRFLKHIERTRLIAHVIDLGAPPPRDPLADMRTIDRELESHNPLLAAKPQVVIANKSDLSEAGPRLKVLEDYCRDAGLELYVVSALTGDGLDFLVKKLKERLSAEKSG